MKHLDEVLQLRDKVDEKSCVAFSGGVDSSLLAKILVMQGFNLPLVSISFREGNEVNYVKQASIYIGGNLYYKIVSLDELEKGLTHIIKTINYDRIALLENAIGYYFIFKYASDKGFKVVLSANGIDELYCGYDVFRRQYHEIDLNLLIDELTDIAKNDKKIIDCVAKLFDLTYYCPFLEDGFIEFSKKIPLNQKIINKEDKLRKHYVRQEAIRLGLPTEIAKHEKNSLQYSSGLHKGIRQLARRNGYSDKEGKRLGYDSGVKAYITIMKNNSI
ncbi:hypothetical protein JW865_09200 [Candidatus Bathyarchaeota archaeon]|nr:hypothetical protein [Candidatus Bathyarchaeota archaeon]